MGGGSPRFARRTVRRGWVFERLDRFSDAEADYRAVLADHPGDTTAKLRLAQVLRQQGKTTDAAPLFEELKASAPASAAIDLGLAQSYRTLGRGDEARRLLDELEARNPTDFAVLLEQGRLSLDEGHEQRLRGWLERPCACTEEYEPNYQLFLCLQRLGDKEAAAKAEQKFKAIEADLKRMGELTEALQNKPHDAEIRFQIAEIFIRRGEVSEGTAWLEGVVRLNPAHVPARSTRRLLRTVGKAGPHRLHRQALPPAGS